MATESEGFEELAPEDVPAEPVSEPETPAEPEPAPDAEPAEDAAEPPAAGTTRNAPEPVPAPWLPDEGIQADVRAAILSLHDRLVALGG